MSIFTQTTARTKNTSNAAMAAAMALMPAGQACQNQQQSSQRQQTQRQSQNMCAYTPLFTKAENKPVFCFFYSYQQSPTHFTKRSEVIVKRPEEILNHARQGGARI